MSLVLADRLLSIVPPGKSRTVVDYNWFTSLIHHLATMGAAEVFVAYQAGTWSRDGQGWVHVGC